jgi:hypothetical protein
MGAESIIEWTPSPVPLSEISGFFKRSGRIIILLTVQEILDDRIAQKPA